jgi:putative transposase
MPSARFVGLSLQHQNRFQSTRQADGQLLLETFNGSLRDERLTSHWFETMEDGKAIIEAWRRDYNETRPHMALNDVPPEEYARHSGALNAEN